MLVCDRLQPLVFCLLPRNLHSDVAEPGIGLGAMPMLYIGGDGDHHAWTKADGLFSVFLIPTFSGRTDEDLPSAAIGRGGYANDCGSPAQTSHWQEKQSWP